MERRIGEFVADLVPDGATVQLGIGAIPAATALALRDKRELGIHTEMFTDPIVDLVEAGVVTGARKERNRGKIVTAFMMGSKRLYDFVDDNPMVEMRAVDFTNDTHVIRSFSRMVAINSAIEVDLTGQVVRRLDRPSPLQRRRRPDGLHPGSGAGRGGQGHHRAAFDGRRRTRSRIVADPRRRRRGGHDARARPDGRHRVGHRRTLRPEHRASELEALIAIAHPDHRDALRAEARTTRGL